jgi:HEAT repeat protein
MDTSSLLAELLSGNETRAEQAALHLAQHPQETRPALHQLLDSPNPDQRWWAIRTLAEFEPEPETTRHLFAALEDSSNEVRQCAALALCQRPDPEALAPLLQALADPDPLVARLAANALIELKETAVPALLAALQTQTNPTALLQIVRALAEIADPRAISALTNAIQSDSALMHYWAKHGLEKLGLGMIYFRP